VAIEYQMVTGLTDRINYATISNSGAITCYGNRNGSSARIYFGPPESPAIILQEGMTIPGVGRIDRHQGGLYYCATALRNANDDMAVEATLDNNSGKVLLVGRPDSLQSLGTFRGPEQHYSRYFSFGGLSNSGKLGFVEDGGQKGIWVADVNTLQMELLAHVGDQVPCIDGDVKYQHFGSHQYTDGDQYLFKAYLDGNDVNESNDAAILVGKPWRRTRAPDLHVRPRYRRLQR